MSVAACGNTSVGPGADEPAPPATSKAPTPGTGSPDPDDLNGDGYRDLLVPVPVGGTADDDADERVGLFYGSTDGLDPATHAVTDINAQGALTADLDSDGFPEIVSIDVGGNTYVAWGGPHGPEEVRQANLGLQSVVRGDFDGDGHHDLAGPAKNGASTAVLYGPFTRTGRPSHTDTSLPHTDGWLVADDIDPTGKPRATSLLIHQGSDGEQASGVLYRARQGVGLSTKGRHLRPGNAAAFGDFDGDGSRDLAVGDDGSRNNEPGYETEAPDVDGSLAVYPVDSGHAVTYQLPEAPEGEHTDYGPGGYFAADPDGDGRDAIMVATYDGATLLAGDDRTEVQRLGPAESNGEETPDEWRHARPAGAADFDADGTDELILHWASGALFGYYGEHPTHWWITDRTTSRDQAAFTTIGLAQ